MKTLNARAVPYAVSRVVPLAISSGLAATLAIAMACGGGGGAVAPAASVTPPSGGNPPPVGSPPAAPSSNVVSTAGAAFSPASLTIPTGSTVTWQIVGATHNVTFGTAKPAAGDVPDSAPGTSVTRTFPTTGTFAYRCTRHSGMTGQIVVQDGATGTPPPGPSPTPTSGILVLSLADRFTPEEIRVPPGTTVAWDFVVAGGIAFKDIAPQGGDIPETAAGGRVARTFAVSGDYNYASSRDRNLKGRIRVR